MSRPSVLIADDHVIVLDGLKALLSASFNVVGTAQDGRTLLAEAGRLKPDVCLIDISMPLLNGIEAVRQLQKACPKTRVVILTMHRDGALLREALHAGALGYVLKQSAVQEVETAISEALAGRCYVSPLIAEVLGVPLAVFLSQGWRAPDDLTPRQREVLQLVAEGKSFKEIAAVLGITVKTAEFHKYRIMQLLGLRTTAELTQYAIRCGIVAPG